MAKIKPQSGSGTIWGSTHTITMTRERDQHTVLTLNDTLMAGLKWMGNMEKFKINISYNSEVVIYYVHLEIPVPLVRIVNTDDPHRYRRDGIKNFNLGMLQAIRYFRSVVKPEFDELINSRKMSLKFAKELRSKYLNQNIFKIKEINKLTFPI